MKIDAETKLRTTFHSPNEAHTLIHSPNEAHTLIHSPNEAHTHTHAQNEAHILAQRGILTLLTHKQVGFN